MSRKSFREGIVKVARQELDLSKKETIKFAQVVEGLSDLQALQVAQSPMNKSAASQLGSTPYGRFLLKAAAEGDSEGDGEGLMARVQKFVEENPGLVASLAGGAGGAGLGGIAGSMIPGVGPIGGGLAGGAGGAGLGYLAGREGPMDNQVRKARERFEEAKGTEEEDAAAQALSQALKARQHKREGTTPGSDDTGPVSVFDMPDSEDTLTNLGRNLLNRGADAGDVLRELGL